MKASPCSGGPNTIDDDVTIEGDRYITIRGIAEKGNSSNATISVLRGKIGICKKAG